MAPRATYPPRSKAGRFVKAPALTIKRCPKCGVDKPLSDFPPRGTLREGNTRYGYCRPCHSATQRGVTLKRKFGITEADYDRMFAEQGGVCAICLRPPKKLRLAVDHHHKSGQVRQLLCWMCNRVLGMWFEDSSRFRRAAEYLDRHAAKRE